MRRFSFTKADRLLCRTEFLRLARIGTKIQNKDFIAVYSPGRTDGVRLGITVTKKVGRAVTRNRIKRYCREYFRLNRDKITGIWDINLIARQEAATLSSEQVFSSLQDLFGRIGR